MSIHEIKVGSTIYGFEGISGIEAEKLRTLVLTDPVNQKSEVGGEWSNDTIRIGYKPGVTDPIELSLQRAARLIGIEPIAVSSSKEYKVEFSPIPSQIQMVVEEKPQTLLYEGKSTPLQVIEIRGLSEEELQQLSNERSLFLNLSEMGTIQKHYRDLGREPTDVEIEMFAQAWSEHCVHKTFKAILIDEEGNERKPLITRIKDTSKKYFEKVGVVTAFNDNSGGIRFYDGNVINIKGETHNWPVAVDPNAGASTKIGGVLRDVAGTGQGGQNLVAFMINNFADPSDYRARTLLLENSRGEREYGNPMGIPTHGISLHFHSDFRFNPTSLGVVVGIIPESHVEKGKPEKGDLIIAVGGKTGRDGIHGATFSSGVMTQDTETVHSTAVQLGDPIVEKTMFDALIACRDLDLIRAITDCGAGGFSSAVGEMAEGVGAEVYLDKILTKYSGLSSWEKWLSESQERMVVAIDPANWDEFKKICLRYDTNADVIGNFTGKNQLMIFESDELVADIDLNFLHSGLPQRRMQMRHNPHPKETREPELPKDLKENYKAVLSHLNVCSKEEMHRMYDQTVQGMTVLSPYTGVYQDVDNDGSVVAPFLDKQYGMVTSHAVNPILNRLDPYWGSVWAFAHAAARFTAIGGNIDEAAGIDNYIAPFPDEEALSDLDKMTEGLCDMINDLEIPMVSGKDSLSSTYRGANGEVVKVPPSLNVTIFGRIADIDKTVSCDFKRRGSTICLVGRLDGNNMGGSVYFGTLGITGSEVPKVDMDVLPGVLQAVHKGIVDGKIKSAKAIGEGGMAAALAKMCFGGDCGAWIEVADLNVDRGDYAIFNETAGCMLIEVENGMVPNEILIGLPYTVIGFTTHDKTIKIHSAEKEFLRVPISELKEAWQRPMKEILNG